MSTKKEVEKTNTGIRKKGELEEIAEISEEIKKALKKVSDKDEHIEDFEYWKPEEKDNEENIKQRTAEKASISEKKVENESNGLKEDFKEAREELEEQKDGKKEKDSREKFIDAYKKIFKPIASETIKIARQIEEAIYSKFMLNFNPYYFDAERFSVSLERNDKKYEISFNSPEKKYRKAMKQRFEAGE